jgi:hypothetical protein
MPFDAMHVRRIQSVCAVLLVYGLAASASPAQGQVDEFGFGGGIAVPVSEAAAIRGPGPHLLAFVGHNLGPRVQLRGEFSFTQLGEEPRDPSRGRPVGNLRVFGLAATLAWSPAGTGRGVYGLAGGGLYAVRSTADWDTNPNFVVPGINLGAGVNFRVGGQPLFAQGRVEVPLSTFGTDTESAPLMYLPFAVGVRFP